MDFEEWKGFKGKDWKEEINVRNFIQNNYIPYEGDETFLAGPTDRTVELWNKVLKLYDEETKNGGVLAVDASTVSTISSHAAGYIDKSLEKIVGLQTDAPLKRAIMPNGGIRIVEKSCDAAHVELSPEIETIFNNYRRTHNLLA